jgi:hypothetical protein
MSNDLNAVLAGRAFKQVDPNADKADDSSERITLEVGDTFVGTLTKRVEFDSKYNPGKVVEAYELTALDGSKKFLISKGNMKWQMSPVKEGQLVKLERLPDEDFEKNGRTMTSSSWVVFVAE